MRRNIREHSPTHISLLLCVLGLTQSGINGCGRSEKARTEVKYQAPSAPQSPIDSQECDKGRLLVDDGYIEHNFIITNNSDNNILLDSITLNTPCCTSTGPLPHEVPARGEVSIPVTLKTDQKTGHKRVAFEIISKQLRKPIVLGLSAQFVQPLEIVGLHNRTHHIYINSSLSLECEMLCRTQHSEGTSLPISIKTADSLSARFEGATQIKDIGDGITEHSRKLIITTPRTQRLGFQRSDLVLEWANGMKKAMSFSWIVNPRISATPSGFLLNKSKDTQSVTITLNSDNVPFRVMSVDSKLLASTVPPSESSAKQTITLQLTTDLASTGAEDVLINTDHPDQPQVKVTVLVNSNNT